MYLPHWFTGALAVFRAANQPGDYPATALSTPADYSTPISTTGANYGTVEGSFAFTLPNTGDGIVFLDRESDKEGARLNL